MNWKRIATIAPIVITVLIFLIQASEWVFPKAVPTNAFAVPTSTLFSASQNEPDSPPELITFQIKQLEVLDPDDTGQTRDVQIYVVLNIGTTVWGYHYPFGEDVFILEGGGGIIPLGLTAGSVDVRGAGEEITARIIVIDSELGSEQVLNDVLSLVGNIAVGQLKVGKYWDLVLSQATSYGTGELLDYLQDAVPVDEQEIALRRADDWSIGGPITVTSENEGFTMTYEVFGGETIASPPIVITATPIFYVPTATPMVDADSSLTIFSDSRAQNNYDGQALIKIPAGEFPMGLTEDQISYLYSLCDRCATNVFQFSAPVHDVYLDDYWIYETEVTVGQYKLCMNAGACLEPHELLSATVRDYFNTARNQDSPVINVDWDMANAYCHWAGGRLPTEAEWEKAARGTDGRLFPWGDQLPNSSLANYNPQDFDVVYVGKFPDGASPYGVLDMAGNVYEWVADWYHDAFYSTDLATFPNPQGPPNFEGQYFAKGVRGGSVFYEEAIQTSGFHDSFEKTKYGNGVGFRCAVDVSP